MGRRDGMERGLVEARGVAYLGLPAAAVVGRSPLRRAAAFGLLAWSAPRAARLQRRLGVDAVLGTGGYVSAPAVLGAVLARRPTLLFEPNAAAGAANRWLSRWAGGAALAFAETSRELRCPTRATGIPVRREFFDRRERAPGDAPRLLVLGGSQGARQLNRLLPGALARAAPALPGLGVVHQVGREHLEEARSAYAAVGLGPDRVRLEAFLDDVAGEMARADLVVSRAGAVTLAEICAVGRAALLVPLALAAGHQAANAARLAAAGGAVVLPPGGAEPESLAEMLVELLEDRPRLEEMGRALGLLARPRAAADIANWLEEMAEAA